MAAMAPGTIASEDLCFNGIIRSLQILWMVGNLRRWFSASDKCNKKAWVLDKFSFVQVINTCASLGALENGRHISGRDHSNWMQLWYLCGGIASLICNAICRSMEEALTVFCRIPSLPGQWGPSAIRFLLSHGTLFIRPPSSPWLRIYNLILLQNFFLSGYVLLSWSFCAKDLASWSAQACVLHLFETNSSACSKQIGGKTNVQRMFFRALVWQPKSKEEDSIKVMQQMRGFTLEEDSMANVLQIALDVLYLLLMTPGGGWTISQFIFASLAEELGDQAQACRYSSLNTWKSSHILIEFGFVRNKWHYCMF